MISNIKINGFSLYVPNRSTITNLLGLGSATIDLATYNRGGRDGIVLGNRFYRQLSFTVEFVIQATNSVDLLEQRNRYLGQLYPHTKRTVEFFLDDGSVRSCQALVTKVSADTPPEQAGKWCQITVQFIADKWYLEGAEHNQEIAMQDFGGMSVPMGVPMDMSICGISDNNNQIVNLGNTESLPKFHITGPLTSFDILNQTNGQQMTVTTALNTNEYIDLDCFDHTAIKNSVSNIRGSVSGNWITLVPGVNAIIFSANSPQTEYRAEIIYFDAYLGI